MDGITSALDSRASFEVTALVVTWIAIVLLALMVVSVLVRVRRLELAQLEGTPAQARPYSGLRGRAISGLVPPDAPVALPGKLVFLSSNCAGCARLLENLSTLQEAPALTLTWLDAAPEALPKLPAAVSIFTDGGVLARELGIGVTPFAVELDADGVILDARPVSRLSVLGISPNGRVADGVA